jgi:hypothetical protein
MPVTLAQSSKKKSATSERQNNHSVQERSYSQASGNDAKRNALY